MLVLSRDGAWLARLEAVAARGGWAFEVRASLPSPGRTPPPERALAVIDCSITGPAPARAIAALRALYPWASIVLVCDDHEMDPSSMTLIVQCGADEVVGKKWTDERLASRFASLRDRALAAQARVTADGGLMADRRSCRAMLRSKSGWKELKLDAGGFALLWRLLEREGEPVTRAALSAALAEATGKERETATLARRIAALKKALEKWPGSLESARGGLYRLASATKRESA